MKNFLYSLIIAAASLGFVSEVHASAEQKETKKVCVDVKDKDGNVVKDASGKPKQNCKEMKVHKKLEGTPVPEKK
jgi:D-serine dehydratase